jgi:hypothetical protein
LAVIQEVAGDPTYDLPPASLAAGVMPARAPPPPNSSTIFYGNSG